MPSADIRKSSSVGPAGRSGHSPPAPRFSFGAFLNPQIAQTSQIKSDASTRRHKDHEDSPQKELTSSHGGCVDPCFMILDFLVTWWLGVEIPLGGGDARFRHDSAKSA
jgi:hypothetical protein